MVMKIFGLGMIPGMAGCSGKKDDQYPNITFLSEV